MLGLAVQPPTQAQSRKTLYPPVAVKLSSESDIYGELSQIWAVATLIRHGEVLEDQLGGKIADSAHPLPEIEHNCDLHSPNREHGRRRSRSNSPVNEKDRAYFYFPDLVINEPGQYRIRVSLLEMDLNSYDSSEGVVRVVDSVDSRPIIVEDGQASRFRPSSRERAFLSVLRNDGQKIPSV